MPQQYVHLFRQYKDQKHKVGSTYIVTIGMKKIGLLHYFKEMTEYYGGKRFNTKREAVLYAEELAEREGLELLLHN